MNAKRCFAGLLLAMAASAAVAAPAATAPACTLKVDRAWVRSAPPGTTMLAGYATVSNPCRKPIAIVGVEGADFGMAMIHQTIVAGGMSKMRHAEKLLVPADGELNFAPGGLHMMLMQPKAALSDGSRTRIHLILEDGSRVTADYPVRREAPAP